MERSAAGGGWLHGFPVALTSFVGRAQVVDEIAGQLDRHRLVTVAAPGGTRAAQERGAVMSLAAVAEYALMLAAQPAPDPAPGPAALSAGLV